MKSILQPDLSAPPSPPSPAAGRRFRRTALGAGDKVPYGGEDRGLLGSERWYGRPSTRSEAVASVMQAHDNGSGIVAACRETIYESAKREPLGRAYVRGYDFPAGVADGSFRFGRRTGSFPAEDSTAPPRTAWGWGGEEETVEDHARYVKSHQAYAPGERVDRRYVWPERVAANPQHRFGRPASAPSRRCLADREEGGVRGALLGGPWSTDQGSAPGGVVTLDGEASRQARQAPLGSRPPSWQGAPPVPAGFAFGAPSRRPAPAGGDAGAETVGRLLGFGLSSPLDHLEPDPDLGRCTREGRRNVTTETRRFGKPSRPAGESEGIASVLAPDVVGTKAVDRTEFSRPRPREEVQSLLQAVGHDLSPRSFAELWEAAVEAHLAKQHGVPRRAPWAREAEIKVPLETVMEAYVRGKVSMPRLVLAGA